MRKQNNNRSQRTIDESHRLRLAKEAFERIKTQLGAIPVERIQPLSLDLDAVSIVARRVSKQVDRPEVRRRFEELPRSYFDATDLDTFRDLALAAWHARKMVVEEHARERVPPELVARGREVRDRMMMVLGYHFARDAEMQATLATMNTTTSHRGLAHDLTDLADLYQERRETLKEDVRWYHAEDESLAESTADEIVNHLERRGAQDWTEVLARLWTMLFETYERIRAVGTSLFHDEPLGPRFPSLHTATRVRRYGKTVEEEEAVGPAPAPADPSVPVAPPPAPPAAPREVSTEPRDG